MNKSLEELIIEEFREKFVINVFGFPKVEELEKFILSSLAQYKREIRERVKKKNKDYKNNTVFMTTDGSLSNYHESGYYEKKGYNQAISDVLAELEK